MTLQAILLSKSTDHRLEKNEGKRNSAISGANPNIVRESVY